MSSKLTTRSGRKAYAKKANATSQLGELESRVNPRDPKCILPDEPFSGGIQAQPADASAGNDCIVRRLGVVISFNDLSFPVKPLESLIIDGLSL
jgi:hypothetical protein